MIELRNISKTYKTKKGEFTALSNVSLTVSDGEIFGIIGLSGAGKSTLVRCINYLERPTSGQVVIDGSEVGRLSKKELLKLRRNIGMIFQGFNLLEQRTVLRNICFPLEIAGVPKDKAVQKARELLELVGLTDKETSY
ncbi:MAG: ATP-binding cassette domain-containing protein, partial [Ruminococcus sp.]|nr:ATP-binding cassette domain-containing protein [Ruminococcus sp.]